MRDREREKRFAASTVGGLTVGGLIVGGLYAFGPFGEGRVPLVLNMALGVAAYAVGAYLGIYCLDLADRRNRRF